MFKQILKKPDGRDLFLYSQHMIPEGIQATSPNATKTASNPQLRWHPLRGEWVAYASHRQNRTFLPPKEYSPLLPTRSVEFPTELPAGDYEVAVFENLFPSLSFDAAEAPSLSVPTRPGHGVCEVVVFTQDPDTSLGQLSLDHIELLVDVWADRYRDLGARKDIQYVLPFENRGVEVGVTLHHPHGQIYAYPFIPPVPARQMEMEKKYFSEKGKGLLEEFIQNEIRDETRMIFESKTVAAFVPICARYPYEVWIAPRRKVPSIDKLEPLEKKEFAKALKTVLLKFDGLWKKPFPYLMVFHQSPTDGVAHPESHFHIQFYPPLRSFDRLKYLAGTEIGAGMFANDSLPEEKAAELRAVKVSFES